MLFLLYSYCLTTFTVCDLPFSITLIKYTPDFNWPQAISNFVLADTIYFFEYTSLPVTSKTIASKTVSDYAFDFINQLVDDGFGETVIFSVIELVLANLGSSQGES
jgi:hypothetical protein